MSCREPTVGPSRTTSLDSSPLTPTRAVQVYYTATGTIADSLAPTRTVQVYYSTTGNIACSCE